MRTLIHVIASGVTLWLALIISPVLTQEFSLLARQRVILMNYNTLVENCYVDNGSKFNDAFSKCSGRASDLMHKQLSAARKEIKISLAENLFQNGYASIGKTHVKGKFEGCSLVGSIFLEDGSMFLCDPKSPSNSYSPIKSISRAEVIILKYSLSGKIVLLIDNVLLEGQILRTH